MSQKTVLGFGSEGEAAQAAAILGEMPDFESFPLVALEDAGQWFLECYDDGALAPGALRAALADAGVAARSEAVAAVPDADWVSETQKALPPVRGGRFLVHGSHDRARVFSQWAIEIDAGRAFGTAHHGTTKGCLLAIGALPAVVSPGRPRRRPHANACALTCGPAAPRTKGISPHPVLLPMGEGTPEPAAADVRASPLLWGEGQGEGRIASIMAGPRTGSERTLAHVRESGAPFKSLRQREKRIPASAGMTLRGPIARSPAKPLAILDLGTGSGVLAIAAGKTFAHRARVAAADIDPIAIAVARENCRKNGAADVTLSVGDGRKPASAYAQAPFDIVVANILAKPLLKLAPRLRELTRRGGILILSGLLDSQAREILARYRATGFRLIQRHGLEGWATLTLRRAH